MSSLCYRGVTTERSVSAVKKTATQLVYRRNVYQQKQQTAAQHTRELVYRGIAYNRGISHKTMRDNWV